jgi:hypothetical protein
MALAGAESSWGTRRAAFGGALTARELWVERICFLPVFVSRLACGDAGQWPYINWCFLPDTKHGPRGIGLIIGDLPRRVFPGWY